MQAQVLDLEYDFLKKIDAAESPAFSYSICTLTTRIEEYHQMVHSFIKAGFNTSDCEFLYIDNSAHNRADGYSGTNWFLTHAKGEYIIICHQDILIDKDTRRDLERKLQELQQLDNNWAICGNAGAAGPNHIVYHISYPDQVFKSKGRFPLKVSALDENFLVIRKSAALATSNDLSGFHLYAADLCLNAEMRGFSAYAISFNLTHKSYGNADQSFQQSRRQLVKKYNRFFRNRWIQTPSAVFLLSGSKWRWLYANPVALFRVRMFNGIKKRR
jgi:hypothetical protein